AVQQFSDPDAQWDYLYHVTDPPVLPDPKPDKCRLDVRRINALQLLELGIHPDQLAIAPYCTFQTPQRFFSYRRTHTKEVQWSGIVSL
ncbi:MAG: laccase domain-containing protein, partial [Synechocystis sp.]